MILDSGELIMRLLSTYKMLIRSHRNPASLRLKDLDFVGRNNDALTANSKQSHYPCDSKKWVGSERVFVALFRSALQPSSLSLPAEVQSNK